MVNLMICYDNWGFWPHGMFGDVWRLLLCRCYGDMGCDLM